MCFGSSSKSTNAISSDTNKQNYCSRHTGSLRKSLQTFSVNPLKIIIITVDALRKREKKVNIVDNKLNFDSQSIAHLHIPPYILNKFTLIQEKMAWEKCKKREWYLHQWTSV